MASKEQVHLQVHVHPNSGRNQISGFRDGVLHVKIAAPPVEGRANLELVRFLSTVLGLGKSSVAVVKGATGHRKTVAVTGMDRERVLSLLSR
jgi:uncharacterized protein (TIGR00251 family)